MARAGSAWSLRATVIVSVCYVLIGVATPAGAAKSSDFKPDPEFQGDGARSVTAITAVEGGWVAVGEEADALGDAHLAIWFSTKVNGAEGSWTRVGDDAIGGAFDNALGRDAKGLTIDTTPHGIGAGTAGVVIAGSATFTQAAGSGQNGVLGPSPAAWFSADDGDSWQSLLLPMPDGAKVGIAQSATSRDGRYVVVGTVSPDDHIGGDGDRPVAWYSDDGTTWIGGHGMIGSVSDEAKALSVTAASSGASPLFLASGSAVANGEQDAAVWISDDGTDWERVDDSEALGKGSKVRDQDMDWVVAIGNDDGFIGVGDEHQSPTSQVFGIVWRSSDGATWTRTSASDAPFASNDKQRPSTIMTGVAIGDGYYVATGYVEKNTGAAARARAWESKNGKKWSPLVVDDSSDKVYSAMLGVDTNGKHYTIVGAVGDDGNYWNGKA